MKKRVRAEDRIGQRFGRLVVLSIVGRYRTTAVFKCLCDCGRIAEVTCSSLVSGHTQSCGCLHSERTAEAASATFKKHGKSSSAVYRRWWGMIERCSNCKHVSYHLYGGRGITVCERWLKFENYYADMGEPPTPQHSLDRIDNSGPYCKENCRWATISEQANNQRSNVLLTHNGKTQTMIQWSRELGIGRATLRKRRALGWSDEQVLSTPTRNGRHANHK